MYARWKEQLGNRITNPGGAQNNQVALRLIHSSDADQMSNWNSGY